MKHRKGASMIELVIAIVVMGIAVMSLPLILTQTHNSNAMALQQEAILATKTKLGYLLSYEWDANSYDVNAGRSRVLDTTGSASADSDFNTTSTRRIGHVIADNRRKLRDDLASPSLMSSAAWGNAALLDMDDFHNKAEQTTVVSADMDYIFNLELNSTVSYSLDTATYANQEDINFTFNASSAPTDPTNIKRIRLRTTDTSNQITIRMDAFASNIGESTISKRAW